MEIVAYHCLLIEARQMSKEQIWYDRNNKHAGPDVHTLVHITYWWTNLTILIPLTCILLANDSL